MHCINGLSEERLNGSSPASTGPAGARFEGQVGAHYLLTMLAYSEPRGLPGTGISHVELQRADDGFPLDDIIVRANEITTGRAATLQIQVKRSIQFSPGDAVFKKVVEQIAEAIKKPDFWTGRNELAIATALTSRKIDGAYQDVLRWARQINSPKTFFDRLNRSGTANDDMRVFVTTLRNHLSVAGAPHDDETVWKVCRRLQILIFDYTAVGSSAEELSRERAVRVLPPKDAAKASSLWSVLTDLAEEIAAEGGDRDHIRLVADLAAKSIRVADAPHLANVWAAIAEASCQAVADMNDRIGATRLARTQQVDTINEALERGRYVEIRGDAGVGKSGILKHFAESFAIEGRIIVLSPGRIAPRGWAEMRAQLGFKGTARELLSDLAANGGAALFIDNLDSFNDEERKTVNDLLRAAADVRGMSVIVTARRNLGLDEPSWLDADAIETLGPAPAVVVDELSETEINELREAEPHLANLLADSHPARKVVRNLYRLSRLVARPKSAPTPTTELDMAQEWWTSGDGQRDDNHRERTRLLRKLADEALEGTFIFDVQNETATPIDALVQSETLRDHGNDQVSFRHDVLRQWAIGNLLASKDKAFHRLPLEKPAPEILARGVELAALFALQQQQDENRWEAILTRLSMNGTHGSWRRPVLLALVHSETADALLDRMAPKLLDEDAALLRELIRTLMAVDVEPASQQLSELGVTPERIPTDWFLPRGSSWGHLIVWILKLGANIPAKSLGDVIELYINWMWGTLGHDRLTPVLLDRLHSWLIELEQEGADGRRPRTYCGELGWLEQDRLTTKLRTGFLTFSSKNPPLAIEYLNRVRNYARDRGIVSSIMSFRGTLAEAAPAELAMLTAESLIAHPSKEEPSRRDLQREEPFQHLDNEFLPEAPSQGPFFELLMYAPKEGLALIRKLVDHAIEFSARGYNSGADGFLIHFDDREQFFPWTATYRWSRGAGNHYALCSALMALEAWAHQRIEAGGDLDVVLADVLGPQGTSSAFVLVAVDVIISHWPKSQIAAVPFLGCPELVISDRKRHALEVFSRSGVSGLDTLRKEPPGAASRESLEQRSSRRASLYEFLEFYTVSGPEDLRNRLTELLYAASERLGAPEPASDFGDPRFMAQHQLNLVDPTNWPQRKVGQENGGTVLTRSYSPPAKEAERIARLDAEATSRFEAESIRAALLQALDDP